MILIIDTKSKNRIFIKNKNNFKVIKYGRINQLSMDDFIKMGELKINFFIFICNLFYFILFLYVIKKNYITNCLVI